MPFDTIVGPQRQATKLPQPTNVVAYHQKKQASKRKLPLSAAPATILTLLILTSFSSLAFQSYAKVAESKKSANYIAQNQKLDPISPSNLSLLGLNLVSLNSLNLAASPMRTKNIPLIVKRGGFESIYQEAEKKYGVPWQIIAAVHYVETGQSGDTPAVSSAGALGPMQFMPGTFERYKQDGDGDGVASIYDVHDAIYSGAKYLAANGGASGNVRNALFRYNHSLAYVEKVLYIAAGYGYTG